MIGASVETVLSVHHLSDSMFHFRTTRDPKVTFKNGQFLMLGLEVDGKSLMRAYSVVSPNHVDYLEFLSIKVQDGAFTSRLQLLQEGGEIMVGGRPSGTLITDNLLDGRNLYLFSTGTGLAPFMSIIRDKGIYERFEKVILVHCAKVVAELAYRDYISDELPNDESFGGLIKDKLLYYPTVTREPFHTQGRIQDLVSSGKICSDLGLDPIDAEKDRVMICGNPHMVLAIMELCKNLGFAEASSAVPGGLVVEKAFVDKSIRDSSR